MNDNRRIFVMAQGEGSRWNAASLRIRAPSNMPEFKQLAMVGDQPNLRRTLELLSFMGLGRAVVICHPPIADALPMDVPRVFLEHPGVLLEGILQSLTLWGDSPPNEAVWLLGDVVFSRRALASLFDDRRDFVFLGRVGANPLTGKASREIFGLKASGHGLTRATAQMALLVRHGAPRTAYHGKLWSLFTACSDDRGMAPMVETTDFTDDLDSPEEYMEFWQLLRQAAERDDERVCSEASVLAK